MLHYQIEFDDYRQHLIHVTLRLLAEPNQELWLPTWIPGSYLMREFAKHIEAVKAYDDAGRLLNIKKQSKNRWQLLNSDFELITIEYDVYAFDLSVRGAYVDQTRLYFNPACICLAAQNQEQLAIELELFLPPELKHFQIATALSHKSLVSGRYTLKAKHYDELVDSPVELAVQSTFSFEVNGIQHHFVLSGQHQANLARLKQDLSKICATEMVLFGGAPFDHYTFMTMATGHGYGGLEHAKSTSLITPRDDLPKDDEPTEPSEAYQRYLGLCSHEYFHAWLVKTIRPENFVDYNLQQESYTQLLWVFEGFTSYYDDLILLRSGVISQASYFKLLNTQIERYLDNPGRNIQTVAESSFDAWIKYYRPDENSNNAGTSYYNKGALLALCLDLGLRSQGSSLDALLKRLYLNAQQGVQVSERSIAELCQQLTGRDWSEALALMVDTTNDLPLQSLLAQFGVNLNIKPDKTLALGLKLQDKAEGVLLQQCRREGSAAKAGLSAHDVIIAVNGIKATEKLIHAAAKGSNSLQIHAFRRDELMQFVVDTGSIAIHKVELEITDHSKLAAWLH